MIKKVMVILAVILVIIPLIVIINLPDILVSLRMPDVLFPDKTKPYSKQVEELENTEKSLRNLKVFVSEQKEKLRESEKILQDLRGEHDKLKPIVESDKRTVEAVFEAHEKKQRTFIWVERILMFIMGIGASLTGSLIYDRIKRKSS